MNERVEQLVEKLNKLDLKLSSLGYSTAMISYDALTIAPKKSVEARAQAMEGLATFSYETFINEDVKKLLEELKEHVEELDDISKSKLRVMSKDFDEMSCIPADEFAEFQGLQAKSSVAWQEAREKEDYSIFAPYLEKVIKATKKFVDYRGKDCHPYEVLLDQFEDGLTIEKADAFFEKMREVIVPMVQKIKDSGIDIDKRFLKGENYPIEPQKEFMTYMMEALGFRMDSGIIGESIHPFTMNLSRDDVRITTRYGEPDVFNTIASTIHETGHAIYEQNVDEAYGLSRIATGTSMGIHESQSRLFENNFGRSLEFWSKYFGKLQELFPEALGTIALEDFYKAINAVESTLIRVDADELTYSLHIMVRYEVEKIIMSEDIDVKDLPELWNDKYEEYLGIRPSNNIEGILQDVHWSEGLFGYFPSYALGSAYSAQFVQAMEKEIDVKEALIAGDFTEILGWLEKHIHRFGRTKNPDEILLSATGESFNPQYYIDYLVDKYTKIYDL